MREIMRLGRALIWRTRREQGRRLIGLPLIFALALLAMVLITLYLPWLLTGPTRYALARAAEARFGTSLGTTGLAMALLFLQGPYLLAMFAAYQGASLAQAAVGGETSRGGLELLLSAPFLPRTLFLALLTSSLSLTLFAWAIMTLGSLGIAAGVLLALSVPLPISAGYLATALLLPLPLALWANTTGLFVGLAFPRLAQLRTGNTNLLQLLAMLPAGALLLTATLFPDLNPLVLNGAALVLGLVGASLAASLLARWFRVEAVL